MVTIYNIILLCLLVFMGLNNILLSQNQSYNEIDKIRQMYVEGEYLKITNYLEKEKKEPLTSNEYYYLGMSYAQLKNLKNALIGLEKAVELDSLNVNYRLNYSRYLNQYGRTKEAVNHYKFIIDKDSSNVIALYELGTINLSLRDYETAKSIFTKVCTLNEDDFLARYYLALSQVYTASTQVDSANAFISISKAISLNMEFIPAWDLGGAFAVSSNKYMMGFTYYWKLTQLDPNRAEYFYRAGFCAEKAKHYDMAIGLLNKAIQRDSTVANYYSHLGYCYFAVSEFDSALFAYEKAAELDFTNPANDINVALTYEKLDSLDNAIIYYESALEKFPYNKIISVFEKLVSINYRQKNYNKVQTICEKALTLDPESSHSLFYMACALDRENKTSKALEYYNKAAIQLAKDEKFTDELKYVNEQIEEIKTKVKERKFWEGKTNEL